MLILTVFPLVMGMRRSIFSSWGSLRTALTGEAIPDLCDVPFLTNSDAHSPNPDKLGREFNRIRIRHRRAKDVLNAIKKTDIEMNVGFFSGGREVQPDRLHPLLHPI